MDRFELMILKEIKRRIEQLPAKLDELGFAGRAEMDIAELYEKIGETVLAGDWWVRSALQAERCGQILDAIAILKIAVDRLPEHLGARRELVRLRKQIEAWSKS